MSIVSSTPEPGKIHPADEAIRLRFDGYLNPNLRWPNTVEVNTGEIAHPVNVRYDPVDKSIVILPTVAFRPRLGYTLRVVPDELTGLTGSAFSGEFQLDFVTGPPSEADVSSPPRFENDVAPIFAQECGCHGPDEGIPPALTPEDMSNRPSERQPDWDLVVPRRPMASYLVLRMLPNYPGITGPTKALDSEKVRTIIRWIRHLPEN